MTELSFAKSFLSQLDSRPLKLQPDHVSDPKTLEITSAYTLPRMPNAMRKPDDTSAASKATATTVTISLKSSRNPVLSMTLADKSLATSILDLKQIIAKELKMDGIEKIKVLYQKKPCSDAKTVKELKGEDDLSGEMELGVMIMGYTASNLRERDAAGTSSKEESKDKDVEMKEAPVAQGTSGDEVLASEEFWDDLKGFLTQRIRDEGTAGKVFESFKGAWKGR